MNSNQLFTISINIDHILGNLKIKWIQKKTFLNAVLFAELLIKSFLRVCLNIFVLFFKKI